MNRTPLAHTRFLSAQDVAAIVTRMGAATTLKRMADYIHEDFLRWQDFDKCARVASHSAGGVIELMPISDAATYAFKYVNGHPKNTLVGLPTVMAFGVLADVATGVPQCLSELTLTTALRTAAMSAVAARALARPDSKTLALIGNGAQSEFQALAFHYLLGIEEIRLFDTDPAATEKLVRNLAHTALRLICCTSVAQAVRGADIVTTVTADKTNATILTPDMIEPGMHINGVGGDCPGKTELHPDVLRGAGGVCGVRAADAHRRRSATNAAGFRRDRTVAGAEQDGNRAHPRVPGDTLRLRRICAGRLFGPALHA